MQFEYTSPQTQLEHLMGGHRCVNAFGAIEDGDDERFLAFLSDSEIPPRTDVYINSSGGSVEAAMNIGRSIRGGWLSTHVGTYVLDNDATVEPLHEHLKPRKFLSGSCLSAATLMYLGGRLRFLDNQSRFGVHQFSFRNPSPLDIGRSQVLSAKIARYSFDMGINTELFELSSSIDGSKIHLIPHEQLRLSGIVTDGEVEAVWSIHTYGKAMYVRGERDSLFGHHKLMLGYDKGTGFFVSAVIESQGRENDLLNMPLVELVVGRDEGQVIDVSKRAAREVQDINTNVGMNISRSEAALLAASDGFGLRLRWSPEAEVFLGIAPMDARDGQHMLRTFVHLFS